MTEAAGAGRLVALVGSVGLGVVAWSVGCAVRLPAGSSAEATGQPCQSAMECPQPNDPCLLAYCEQQQCIHVAAPEGPLPDEMQQPNDCVHLYCDGQGNASRYPAAYDRPADDGNPCTAEGCRGTEPVHANVRAGTPCPDGFCTETGQCGVCLAGTRQCDGNGTRGCGTDGQWSSTEPCPPSSPLCEQARCLALRSFDVGASHACARFDDGSVRCWGEGSAGQLGQSEDGLRAPAPGLTLRALDVGRRHACGVDTSGRAWCWGGNQYGQLGDGTFEHSAEPVEVALPAGVEAWATYVGSEHSCVLDRADKVWCWGRNDRGQLGHGAAPRAPLPPIATGPEAPGRGGAPARSAVSDVSELRLTGSATCVRTATTPALRCWGMPAYGPPVDEPSRKERRAIEKASRPKPTLVEGIDSADALRVGAHFACAMQQGQVLCWGANDRGQLGTQPLTDRFAATAVAGVTAATALAVGWEFACAATEAGPIWCWGANDRGQLGREGADGPPAAVAGLEGVDDLRAGADFVCAAAERWGMRCWGAGGAGQLGVGSRPSSFQPLPVEW